MRSIFVIFALMLFAGCSTTIEQSAPLVQAIAYTEETTIAKSTSVPAVETEESVYEPPKRVIYPAEPGTIVVDQKERKLYLVGEDGTAMRYTIAIGKDGGVEAGERLGGVVTIGRKAEWPSWTENRLGAKTVPGCPKKPLGARALYLFDEEGRDTIYRIHGTNAPASIGKAASSGCFRMRINRLEDLYDRVPEGTKEAVI